MFERRLKVLLLVAGLAAAVVVGRLFQLQVVRADYYREQAARSLILRPKPLPFVRGDILDRTGEVLVRDEACWDVTVDYDVLAASATDDPASVSRRLRRSTRAAWYPRGGTGEEVEWAFRGQVDRMWLDLAMLTAETEPLSVDELLGRAKRIHDRVERVRRAVARRRGFDSPVAEEKGAHAILTGLDGDRQVAAREQLAAYAWVHIEPASARTFAPRAEPFAHLLGRVGRVTAETVADDPSADDPFRRYLADERVGTTGVEAAAEHRLRGRRGQIVRDRSGELVTDRLIDPQDGETVTVTVHAGLQRRLYALLGATVEQVADSSGGAIVVLDVQTREVLALVSYPSYDPSRFRELFVQLRDDTERLPLSFRPVAGQYAPGSTVKPLVCLAGLMNGQITLDTRESCNGYLFDDVRNRWRCWRVHGTAMRKAHGSIDVVEALTGSCNVFMYRLGERLGADRICSAFDLAGFGRSSGTGLPEEVKGINPTPAWLMQHRGRSVTPGTARLFAMGQGEILVTPVQVANLMATYASGVFRPVTLIRTDGSTPAWRLPADEAHLRAIRRGMYGVVNDPDGTARRHAYFAHDRYAMCGKTGSATAPPRPTSYRMSYRDENGVAHVELLPAGSRREATDRFRTAHPRIAIEPAGIEVVGHWPRQPPLEGDNYSHAWFGAFLQALDPTGRPDWSVAPRIAFAVLVEFGGSGGRTSGPLARQVASELLRVFGPELDPDSGFWEASGS